MFLGYGAEEEVKMVSVVDDINAYTYSYPLELPSKKLTFKWYVHINVTFIHLRLFFFKLFIVWP